MCTKDYNTLNEAMRDAERIEAAIRRTRGQPSNKSNKPSTPKPTNDGAEPMEIGNIQLQKLTPAEREKCMKEGRCLRCREKGHIAKNCPKARRN